MAREADHAASEARGARTPNGTGCGGRWWPWRREVGEAGRLGELERAAQAAAIEASRHEETLGALARERELALDSLPQPGPIPDADGEEPAEAPAHEPVPPSEELVAELAALDDELLDTELRRVRRTLSQIGSVNPFAVEEHRDLSGRLEDLTTQDADLGSAIAGTEELIAQLDADITSRFNAAFAAIGERFDDFCRLLFAGGSASLQLGEGEDGEAPGGIEIVVRPPGKRLQRLAMLSGGERALTGVALLFAMLSVNPVPFCILDEVDAALDEANIGRFADALRRLSEDIDFVVITAQPRHHRGGGHDLRRDHGRRRRVGRRQPAAGRHSGRGGDRMMPRPAREPTGMGLRPRSVAWELDCVPCSRAARPAPRPGTTSKRR